MVHCCVRGCRNSTYSKQSNVSFFRIPTISTAAADCEKQLILDRRNAWLQRLNRCDIYQGARVCSEHFVSDRRSECKQEIDTFRSRRYGYKGRPAALHHSNSVDWAPSCMLTPVDEIESHGSSVSGARAHVHGTGSGFYGTPKKRKMSPMDCVSTQDAATQCELITTSSAATQCLIEPCTENKGMQVDEPTVKSSGVNCRLLRSAPKATVDMASPSVTALSSQMTSSHGSDLTYQPSQSDESQSDDADIRCSTGPAHLGTKFLVYKDCLAQLFEYCAVCSKWCDVNWNIIGSFVSVSQSCRHCQHSRTWTSQPFVANMPAGNISLSAAIYFTGGSFAKISKFMSALRLQSISEMTFYTHARQFLQPTVMSLWNDCQAELLRCISERSGDVVLGGDMRADSPGHCAKYGSYTMMDLRSSHIVDIQLIQSNEVGGSCHMEKAGLERSLELLQNADLSIDAIVTDRHPQVQKFLREKVPSIAHYYDVWHVAKGLTKKLEALGNKRGCEIVHTWTKSIVNHLYWSAASSVCGDEVVAKWTSIINHIQNVHEHDNWRFPRCLHAELDEARNWFSPSTEACERLADLLGRKKLLTDIQKLSPHLQTSSIEAFHSLILQFAPKHLVYSYNGMLCRLLLAALHFNENADRPQLVNKSGESVFRVRFPKFKKGGFSVTAAREAPTSGYVDKLLVLLMSVLENPDQYQQLLSDITVPKPLCADFHRPAESEILLSCSRFNNSRHIVCKNMT